MRTIDADALQNILLPIANALEHEYGSLGGAVSGCIKHIDNAPTVDAVPVVRCRECYYGSESGDLISCGHPEYDLMEGVLANEEGFYCGYGKRKEGADHA